MNRSSKAITLFFLIFFGVLTGTSANKSRASTEIDSQSAPIVYEVKTEIPTPRERIAMVISEDYRQLNDEFSRHEFLQTLAPVIERRIEAASKETSFSVIVGLSLPEYNFERKGFPTGCSNSTFIPFEGGYALRFSNPDEIAFLSVPVEEAKKAAAVLKSSRNCSITFTGTIDKCVEEELNFRTYKVIYLKVRSLRLKFKEGAVEFTKQVP